MASDEQLREYEMKKRKDLVERIQAAYENACKVSDRMTEHMHLESTKAFQDKKVRDLLHGIYQDLMHGRL